MLAPPFQAQQDTTEKEKVQNFFGLSLFYAAQILTSHIIDKTLGSAQHCRAIII